ncbi:class I SAM-dependent methyltransferase [Nocardia otitidiscaviarum]|uniref:class I SAM-dependent methyltransferase n=1 Tax=Nocardia otitidiscaviarum TaxID=1823 RepID=UPI00189609AD|nr:class I SAM-dependent methyltransferase [Nocardia otitidiscaviarum]MBF6178634.1 class I SAM-dependent methyltransferase [Nocardia otitidiscaviarum]
MADDEMLVVGTAYDRVAELYAATFEHALRDMPFDRALLGVFAELASDPVLDLGCGPGRLTGHLRDLGLDVSGVDLSPEMIRLARAAHPDLRFEAGSMEALELPDASLGGILAWYSTIHTHPRRLPLAFAEIARVLRPDGVVLLGFQATERGYEAYDHRVTTAYRWAPDALAELLVPHGLHTVFRMVREPQENERGAQGCLLAVRR